MAQKDDQHHHYILPTSTALAVGATLLILTAVTVWVAHIDLGRLNFFIAMFVATIKGTLVALFFMNLKKDKRENSVIFATSFLFLAIFMVLTSTDILFRGNVFVKDMKVALFPDMLVAKSTIKKPWVSTPELVSQGHALFAAQCVSCHGNEGKGDGPASAALDPKPRNFTSAQGWKNGRKPSLMFKTLRDGLNKMPSFKTLPSDDRWRLIHYVLTLGPSPEADSKVELAAIGIDPTKDTAGAEVSKSISVELAMQRLAVADDAAPKMGRSEGSASGIGAQLYQAKCAQCHSSHGDGGVAVKNLGVNPKAYVRTHAFSSQTEALRSFEAFSRVVVRGLPGDLMPGSGNLSDTEMHELFQYVKGLSSR